MFVCQNQPCGARWADDEVEIRNEGQGPLFRCPQCGARNLLEVRPGSGDTPTYRQIAKVHKAAPTPRAKASGKPPAEEAPGDTAKKGSRPPAGARRGGKRA
ncbi:MULTISPECIES: hypothetical protein [unclassified Cupriavidus]|uniref:hypothetical protein n=1 Tax=unclassified Cupriavidus TaxID=2640874 RepID=UPI00139BE59C|nr:hypothetical protein [Cupriavidus sp. SW-Y-13]MWL87024.1 hypothetical protein [Cupriavidus sp. SW-Y-13]